MPLASKKMLDLYKTDGDLSEGDSGIDDEAVSRQNVSLILHGQFDAE